MYKRQRNDFASRATVEALVERVRGAGISLKYDAAAPVGKTIASIFEAVADVYKRQAQHSCRGIDFPV